MNLSTHGVSAGPTTPDMQVSTQISKTKFRSKIGNSDRSIPVEFSNFGTEMKIVMNTAINGIDDDESESVNRFCI